MILFLFLITPLTEAKSKTYILVAGAWHGGWVWAKVIPLLEAKGHRAIAVDLPGQGESTIPPSAVNFDDYVKYVVNVANEQEGSVILIGHSMSGIVIAQAAEVLGKEKVSKLIFLDAFMPKNGETVVALANKVEKISRSKSMGPSVMESLIISDDQKTSILKPENIGYLFYHDCKPKDIEFAKKHVKPQPMVCLVTPVALSERYNSIPKYYILCTEAHDLDKSILANNVPCKKIFKLKSSHSPFYSMPERLVRIIEQL